MLSIIDNVMGNTYGKIAVVDFGIQWACWAVASLLKTEKFYDLAGTCKAARRYDKNKPNAPGAGE